MGMIKVTAATDDSGHWHLIPSELAQEFYKDCENTEMADSGEFSNKWGKYMTGGSLNLVQLYIQE